MPEASCRAGWRSGRIGALRMGLDQGLCCIGCCWALMLVLFVGGAMSLTTIAVLTLVVAVEKLAPRGELLARLGSLPLIAWGLWLIAGATGVAPDLS
jgi:predicted metal-binding membrane protein